MSQLTNYQFSALELSAELDIDEVADVQAADFIALRTPPVSRRPTQKTDAGKRSRSDGDDGADEFGPNPAITASVLVRWRNPAWVRIAVDTAVNEVTDKHSLEFRFGVRWSHSVKTSLAMRQQHRGSDVYA